MASEDIMEEKDVAQVLENIQEYVNVEEKVENADGDDDNVEENAKNAERERMVIIWKRIWLRMMAMQKKMRFRMGLITINGADC